MLSTFEMVEGKSVTQWKRRRSLSGSFKMLPGKDRVLKNKFNDSMPFEKSKIHDPGITWLESNVTPSPINDLPFLEVHVLITVHKTPVDPTYPGETGVPCLQKSSQLACFQESKNLQKTSPKPPSPWGSYVSVKRLKKTPPTFSLS